ncbi:hypothetical protein D3C76_1398930 [compost metagenome]
MSGNCSNSMPNKKNILKRREVELHEVNDGPRIFKENSLRVIKIHRTLSGMIRELHNTEGAFFTI